MRKREKGHSTPSSIIDFLACQEHIVAYVAPFAGACYGLPRSYHLERQSAAADLLLLDTYEFISRFEKTIDLVLPMKNLRPKEKICNNWT